MACSVVCSTSVKEVVAAGCLVAFRNPDDESSEQGNQIPLERSPSIAVISSSNDASLEIARTRMSMISSSPPKAKAHKEVIDQDRIELFDRRLSCARGLEW